MLEPLTADELAVGLVIQEMTRKLARPITLEELAAELGLTTRSGAWRWVDKLRRKGWIADAANPQRKPVTLSTPLPQPVDRASARAVAEIALIGIETMRPDFERVAYSLALRLLKELGGDVCRT